MLNIKRVFGVKVECEETPGSLYMKLLRKAGLRECRKGDITFDIKIDCPDKKKNAKPRKAGARKK